MSLGFYVLPIFKLGRVLILKMVIKMR